MQAITQAFEPKNLAGRVRDMIGAGRVNVARPLIAALRTMGGAPEEVAALEISLLMRENRVPEAMVALDKAIDCTPMDSSLLLWRSELRLGLAETMLAADDAAAAVIADPRSARAKAMLGISLLRMQRFEEGLACLEEAAREQPGNPAYQQAVAEAQQLAGNATAAAISFERAIARWPTIVTLRAAGIMSALRRQDFDGAVSIAREGCRLGAADANVFGLLGHALSSLGCDDEAAYAYGEALKLAPEDPYVRHLVAAAGARTGDDRAPDAYIAAVFDGYAKRFEAHLIGLGYRLPGVIRVLLSERFGGDDMGTVLDLGCGTGFVGVALSDMPMGRLTGVDLSSGMLDEARQKSIYSELYCEEIAAFLGRSTGLWNVIVAADVLSYMGDLSSIFELVRSRLAPRGCFVLSLEHMVKSAADPELPGWRLLRQGRYTHDSGYMRASARKAGLQVGVLRKECIRYEAGAPVEGLIVLFERGEA